MNVKGSSFAKINLFLHVTGKRADGYHDLYSLMTRISLCDDIHIDFSFKEICVTCDHPEVPEDESNLAFKAAALFFKSLPPHIRKKEAGAAIRIDKKIPPGGGLGGGSSNAAFVLTALNRHFEYPFSKTELMALGLRLGADVPFFIFGGPAIAEGVGEKLTAVKNLTSYHLVLCDPGVAASTAEVYKNIDFRLTSAPKYNMNTGLNVPLGEKGFGAGGQLQNDLMEPACRLYPEIRKTKEEMEQLLGKEVLMTGSGSSLFALFSNRDSAQSSYETLTREWRNTERKIFLSTFN